MPMIHVDAPDDFMRSLIRASFPSYRGRKFRVDVTDRPINVKSYWDGGSRDYYVFLHLADLKAWEMPAQSAFDPQIKGADAVTLPPGVICVRHSFFCGKDFGLTFYIRPEDSVKMLEPGHEVELTWAQKVVLCATRSFKSPCRLSEAMTETGISRLEWENAKKSLTERQLLNRSGAITTKGRNAIGLTHLWQLKTKTA